MDLTNLILEKLSIDTVSVEWTLYSTMDELRGALKSGEVDMICPEYHSHYEAQRNGFAISESVMNVPMGLLTLASANSDQLESITTVETRPGIIYVKDVFPNVKLIPLDSVDEMVKAVSDGRVTGAISHIFSLQDSIYGHELEYTLSPLSVPCYICYAALEENNELIMIMDRGYHLISQAERNTIEVSNFTKEKTRLETARDFFRENMGLIIVAILVLTAVVIIAVNRSMFAKRLQRTLDELTRKNEIIENARIELSAANEAAQKADRAKTTFLFNMSHDIRTPLNAVIGYVSMARKHCKPDDTVNEYLNKIDMAGNNLLTVVNQVLEMSRIESGNVEIVPIQVNLLDNFKSLEAVVGSLAAKKNIELISNIGKVENPLVMTDMGRLDQILMNILGNAIKYTNDGGQVTYRMEQKGNVDPNTGIYEFVISDTGIGMSEVYLPHIFDAFTREKNTTMSGIQGTGLGMSIVKSLVELMNGEIHVDSKENVGTTVTICIPMAIAQGEFDKSSDTFDTAAYSEIEGRRVLLVEDNEMNREISVDLLSDMGLVVDTAEDGDIAVEKVKNSNPGYYDLILMDIQMPRVSGYEATGMIRALEDSELSMIPIIALSANAFEEDRMNSLKAGMNDHVSKPIDKRVLIDVMLRYI